MAILGTIRVIAAPKETAFSLPEKLMALRDRQALRYRLEDTDDAGPPIQRMLEQARLAAETSVPITLIGEPGAGKEWLARAIHERSERRHAYFACLDSLKLPPAQIDDVLFGRGTSCGFGTIYLHGPEALTRELQAKIVQATATEGSPRLIVGFRADPQIQVQAGRLLEELYCDASPVTIAVPPLRERLSELPRFIALFLDRSREWHKVQGVADEAAAILRTYAWPENLRELQAVLRDACRRAKGDRIEAADLPFHLKHGPLPVERRLPLDRLLEQVERRLIALALQLTQGNQTRAAELLEVWRPRLVRRLEKLGIKPQDDDAE